MKNIKECFQKLVDFQSLQYALWERKKLSKIRAKRKKANEKTSRYEKCVLCGGETTVLKETHIDERGEKSSLGGAGEVCGLCKRTIQPSEEFEKEMW